MGDSNSNVHFRGGGGNSKSSVILCYESVTWPVAIGKNRIKGWSFLNLRIRMLLDFLKNCFFYQSTTGGRASGVVNRTGIKIPLNYQTPLPVLFKSFHLYNPLNTKERGSNKYDDNNNNTVKYSARPRWNAFNAGVGLKSHLSATY